MSLYRFPSETTACFAGKQVSKYLFQSNIVMGCIIPQRRRKIMAAMLGHNERIKELTIKTPEILWILEIRLQVDNDLPCSVYQLNKSKKGVVAAPYQIGNVDEDGDVCFGDNEPCDLKQAHSFFFTSIFNKSHGLATGSDELDPDFDYEAYIRKWSPDLWNVPWKRVEKLIGKLKNISWCPKGRNALIANEDDNKKDFDWVLV